MIVSDMSVADSGYMFPALLYLYLLSSAILVASACGTKALEIRDKLVILCEKLPGSF